MSAVDNERIKLAASALDRASTACLTVGVIVPPVASLVGLPGYVFGWTLLGISAGWLVATFGLHLMAQLILGRLR